MAFIENFNPFDRRSRASDYLNNLRFHILDVSFQTPIVLSYAFGFRSVTAPTIQAKLKEIKQGTFEFTHYTVEAGSVGQVTMEQGVRLFNSDFYNWIDETIPGKVGKRRNLLLIQYSDLAIGGLVGRNFSSPNEPAFLNQALGAVFQPLQDLVSRVPARAWLMIDCLPVEYRAGSDFDSLGAEISIAQLTIQPHRVIEYNLGL